MVMRTHKQLLCFILLTCGMISHIVTVVGPDSSPAEVPGMHVYKVIGAVNGDSKPNIKVTADMHDILQEYVGTSQIVQDPTVLYEVLKQLEEKVKVLSVKAIVNSPNSGFLMYSELNIMVLADLTLQLVRVKKRCYAMHSGNAYLFEFYKGINNPDYKPDVNRANRFTILLNLPEMYDGSFKCPDFYGAHVKI